MPNGGADCCGWCVFNRANNEIHGKIPESEAVSYAMIRKLRELRAQGDYCTIRGVPITDPYYTYCDNFYPEYENLTDLSDKLTKDSEPHGPIYSTGLNEEAYMYTRIPWNGKRKPKICNAGKCHICSQKFNSGGIEVRGWLWRTLKFCSNKHYIEWWNKIHSGGGANRELSLLKKQDPKKK